MKLQKIISLAVALALVPLSGWPAVAEVAPPPQSAPLPSMDYTKQLSHQAGEVVKLVSSGVPNEVVKAYVENAPATFNLSSDNIIHLQQAGVSGVLLTEMLNHDRALRESAGAMPPPGAQAYPPNAPYQAQTPPPEAGQPDGGYANAQAEPDYYTQLSPYGNWNYVAGYGYGWQPYYGLDYSYYSWPVLGFGYWWNCPGRGWCWFPRGGFRGGFGGFRGGFAGGFRGFDRGFRGGFGGRSFGGFGRSSVGFHSFGGGHSFGGHFGGGVSHSIGGGGHGGGFGGGHGGGGHR